MKPNAASRYSALSSSRAVYLDKAWVCSQLTLPYLIRKGDYDNSTNAKIDKTPWQSVGAKGVSVLSSKLMLALLPPQQSFFKLQLTDQKEIPPEIRSELDLTFAKIERTINEMIAASDDRVVVHQALKNLVVAGNALIFMGKDHLKMYPLNRFVVERDGNGNVIEIVTKEHINKNVLGDKYKKTIDEKSSTLNHPSGSGPRGESLATDDNVTVYTHVKRIQNKFEWQQEVDGKIIPGSQGKAPIDATPWLILATNRVDGEMYGRGRVEEYLGDLKSLEALSQALVEGSAAAAKVVFTVSPSASTKPATLASAGNGAIIQGRPDDIGVVQVGKTADFRTAYEMAQGLEKRLSDAFLIMQVRNSERTTAEEVRMTQLELEQQLSGAFSLLTVDFLVPYLNRKLLVAQRSGKIPRLPPKIVAPTIVAGLNALGRSTDREALTQYLQVLAQTMGPEVLFKFVNPDEVCKRFAASVGVDVLNLVKSTEEIQGEKQAQMQQAQQMELVKQQAALESTPMKDPSKNPQLLESLEGNNDPIQEQYKREQGAAQEATT